MASLDHQPSSEPPEPASARNTRNGLILFAVYLALYGGFMALSAFAPSVMDATVGGVNLAILYGLGLILAAFLLALLYARLCRAPRNGTGGGR